MTCQMLANINMSDKTDKFFSFKENYNCNHILTQNIFD